MPSDGDLNITLGEVGRSLVRVESALNALTQSVNDRFDAFDSKVVKKDHFDLEMVRVNDRFIQLDRRFMETESKINDRFRSVDSDIAEVAQMHKDTEQSRKEKWSAIMMTGILPLIPLLVAGALVALITVALQGGL